MSDCARKGTIVPEYRESGKMHADLLTKSLAALRLDEVKHFDRATLAGTELMMRKGHGLKNLKAYHRRGGLLKGVFVPSKLKLQGLRLLKCQKDVEVVDGH